MQFSAATTPPRLFTLILVCGLSVVSLNMFLPSLPNIAAEFEVDYALANLSIAGYAAVTAVLQLIMAPLSDRFGRRPVILTALAIFVIASLGCWLATDIQTFLFFRIVQGAIIAGHAVSLAVIRDTADPQQAASRMGYVAMAWAIAPMLGPMLGGTVDEIFGWRANFLVFFIVGTAILGLCWLDLGETNKTPTTTILAQFRAYPELFRSRRYWGYTLCGIFSIGAFYTFLGGAPLVATSVFGMTPIVLGMAVGTITAGFIFGSFLSGRFAARFPLTTMMIAGRLVACSGLMLGLVLIQFGLVHPVSVFGACVFVGIGNGLTTPASNSGAMSIRPQLSGSAAGLSGALVIGGGAALSAITGSVVTQYNGTWLMLSIMLLSSIMALLAALYVRWLDSIEN